MNEFNFDNKTLFDEIKKEKIHIRIQQLGKRSVTLIENLDDDLDLKRICKDMRKKFSCNGTVTTDDESEAEIIKLQGDQRENVKNWLIDNQIVTSKELDRIVTHGY